MLLPRQTFASCENGERHSHGALFGQLVAVDIWVSNGESIMTSWNTVTVTGSVAAPLSVLFWKSSTTVASETATVVA